MITDEIQFLLSVKVTSGGTVPPADSSCSPQEISCTEKRNTSHTLMPYIGQCGCRLISLLQTRPPHIIFPIFYSLIPEIIFYYSCNYSFLSVTFSYKNTINSTRSMQILKLCDTWLSPTSSKAFLLPCDSCLSIARYAQLSQVCLHVAISSNFEH